MKDEHEEFVLGFRPFLSEGTAAPPSSPVHVNGLNGLVPELKVCVDHPASPAQDANDSNSDSSSTPDSADPSDRMIRIR